MKLNNTGEQQRLTHYLSIPNLCYVNLLSFKLKIESSPYHHLNSVNLCQSADHHFMCGVPV